MLIFSQIMITKRMGMKSNNRQNGSVHMIVIGILAVALVGVLGWIFWQNIVQKPQSQQTSLATNDSTKVKSDSSQMPKITFDKWGMEASLPAGANIKLGEYSTSEDGSTYYALSGENATEGCNPKGRSSHDGVSLFVGTIARRNASSTSFSPHGNNKDTWAQVAAANTDGNLKQVGDYVYDYLSPDDVGDICDGDPQTSNGREANKRQEELSAQAKNLLGALRAN